MSLRNLLGANRPKDVLKEVDGGMIRLIKGRLSVIVPLKEWNIYGLDLKVEF